MQRKKNFCADYGKFCVVCAKNFKIFGIKYYFNLNRNVDVENTLRSFCYWPGNLNIRKDTVKLCAQCIRLVRSLEQLQKKCLDKQDYIKSQFNSTWQALEKENSPVRFKRVAKSTPIKGPNKRKPLKTNVTRKIILHDGQNNEIILNDINESLGILDMISPSSSLSFLPSETLSTMLTSNSSLFTSPPSSYMPASISVPDADTAIKVRNIVR